MGDGHGVMPLHQMASDGGTSHEARTVPTAVTFPYNLPTYKAFVAFYNIQGIAPEDQWEEFVASLTRPSPTIVRIKGIVDAAEKLRDDLENTCIAAYMRELEVKGEASTGFAPVPWFPDNLAFKATYSDPERLASISLGRLHERIKEEMKLGRIVLEDERSMAIPLLLDIQPHNKILEICASPGSSTLQLLEKLYAGSAHPSGFLVANSPDADFGKELLQCNGTLHPALVVTRHDSHAFPMLRGECNSEGRMLHFDRVICDVPCSQDGTLRKNPGLWRFWNVEEGKGLHALQVRIGLHSANLLEAGGIMVYSTCSLNPLENEAVIAEVLRQADGALILVDARLPNLHCSAGLEHWCLEGAKGSYCSWQDAKEAEDISGLAPSMFPPDDTTVSLNLSRCMRILPHQGDTGGYFIAVIHKVPKLAASHADSPVRSKRGDEQEVEDGDAAVKLRGSVQLRAASVSGPEAVVDGNASVKTSISARVASTLYRQAPIGLKLKPSLAAIDPQVMKSIVNFFGLESSYPTNLPLVTLRSANKSNTAHGIYLVTPGVLEVAANYRNGVYNVTFAGLKVFQKSEVARQSSCAFHLTQAGLCIMASCITKQIVCCPALVLQQLLQGGDMILSCSKVGRSGSKEPKSAQTSNKSQKRIVPEFTLADAETLSQLELVKAGCILLTLRHDDAMQLGLQARDVELGTATCSQMIVICWYNKGRIRVVMENPSQLLLCLMEAMPSA